MICAGNSTTPMECDQEAITIISGFSMCKKHADEMVYVFRMAKQQAAQARLKPGIPYRDPDLVSSKTLNIGDDFSMTEGKWRNVKNTT